MKTNPFKLIFLISLILSVMGIFAEISDYYQYRILEPGKSMMKTWFLKSIYVDLGFSFRPLNIYNVIFYILLLFGAIFFYNSKGKEVRFIRLFYSVLLITNIFILFRIVFANIFLRPENGFYGENVTQIYIYKIISFLISIFYIVLSFKILKITSLDRELDIQEKNTGERTRQEITETSKTERLLHHLLDTLILMFLIFSIGSLFSDFERVKGIRIIPEYLNNRYGLLLFLVLLRFIYFPFFERIFGSTPGKFLTNSRVINSKAEIPTSSHVFGRTLYRNIPFNAFSFLFGKGWHDSISKTFVVKEKNIGVRNIFLVWVFVFCFLIICFYIYQIGQY